MPIWKFLRSLFVDFKQYPVLTPAVIREAVSNPRPYIDTLKLPGPAAEVEGSLTVTIA